MSHPICKIGASGLGIALKLTSCTKKAACQLEKSWSMRVRQRWVQSCLLSHYQSTVDAVCVYVVPRSGFLIVPSYPHYPHSWCKRSWMLSVPMWGWPTTVDSLSLYYFRCRSQPLGGIRGFRWGRHPGCYVTKFAPHQALK